MKVIRLVTKAWLIIPLLLLAHFYQTFWLNDAFSEKGVEFAKPPSLLSKLTKASTPELTEAALFGQFKKKTQAQPEETLVEIFESADIEYIGKVGNHQYILYATADFGGRFTAKLLVKELTSDEVYVKTVKNKDKVEGAQVTGIKLSELVLTPLSLGQNSSSENAVANAPIKLLLFTKKTPPKTVQSETTAPSETN